MTIFLTVYADAVKTEIESKGFRTSLGFFRDEPDALGAASEHLIIASAILPQLRRLPSLEVSTEYRIMKSNREPQEFRRAAAARLVADGRRFVLLPAASTKPWIAFNQ